MKKILFMVCTHGNELAGLSLFLKYPYGKNSKTEWEVVVANPEAAFLNSRYLESDLNRVGNVTKATTNEQKRALFLQEKMKSFDVVYDIHTTTTIREKQKWNRCLFVNTIGTDVMNAISYIPKSFVIYDSDPAINKMYLTAKHHAGITLEYAKHANVETTRNYIFRDFFSIINEKKYFSSHIFLEFERPVTQKERDATDIHLSEFILLTDKEKKLLELKSNCAYYPVFINPPEIDPQNYCFLNKKIEITK